MAEYPFFAVVVGSVLIVLLVLTRFSAAALPIESDESSRSEPVEVESTGLKSQSSGPSISTVALLANVTVSQGLFAIILLGAAWYFSIPLTAFGEDPSLSVAEATMLGLVVGFIFYGLNELATAIGRQRGLTASEALRSALAPETAGGWAVLLLVVLPIIAGFEELLFRGALIGVFAIGFDVSPWLLAVGSSVAFALGHGAQGRLGVVVTGLLGFGLATVFILTDSLLVVIVAHYVVNACEFIVHEGIGSPFSSSY